MAASFTCMEQRTIPNREDVGCSSQGLGDIFLSHSGPQKPFVERLYDALVRANHTVFLDKHSLPLGYPFPDNIKRALRGCKVGVVVLSKDFLTRKWPMIELGLLFEDKKPVIPLFYLLSTEDLKSKENLSGWQEKWKEMVKDQQQEIQWTAAVTELPKFNGIVFNKERETEDAYINRVVTKICSDYHPYAPYDQSSIRGSESLAKVITGHFDKLVENVNHLEEACVVGLHGVGGLGKTTLCKSMVNFYNSKYLGRSCLIEFPTTRDMGMVVNQCQLAMRQLFKLRDEGSEVKDFDQVVGLMKKHVGTFDVFLAIDNIWEHSIEEAGRLLSVGFTAKSKVLLTSRSREILSRLLSHTSQKSKDHYHINFLPAPDMEVAFQIFQQIMEQGGLTSLPFSGKIQSVLERCREKNHGGYHPLAVRALGAIAARLFGHGDLKRSADFWSLILQKLENAELKDMEAVIRLNYDTLDENQRHIFLDIGILLSNPAFKPFLKCTYADVNRWLQFYYKFDEIEISALVDDLAAAGVILIQKAQYDEKMIEVHDLYVELAQKEATKGPRFLTSTEEAVEGMEWGNLKRVILAQPEEKQHLHQFGKLQLHRCEKLELLYVYGMQLKHFPKSIASLRVLILQWPWDFDSKRTLLNLNGFVNLEYLRLENLPSLVKLEGPNGFRNLRMFFLRNCAHVEDLDIVRFSTQLEALVIDGVFHYGHGSFKKEFDWAVHPFLMDVRSVGPLKGLEVGKSWLDLVIYLQMCKVAGCRALKRLPDLSPALKVLNVTGCTALKRLPDLGGLTSLETLWLHNNTSLMEMGAFSPALKTVIITDCQAVRLLDLGSVTGLEALILQNTGLSEVGHLSSALKFVIIDGCSTLKKMPALGGMMGLETLKLTKNASLEEIVSLGPALRYLHVEGCVALKRMPADLGGVTGLERLTLAGNASLEEVGRLSPALKYLDVWRCKALKRMPDLGGVTGLERLRLWENASLEEVGRLSPALKELEVEDCAALQMMPELEGLTGLRRLTLSCLSSLEEVGCLGPALEHLHVRGCGALKRMTGLGGVTRLTLEEVCRLSPALKELTVEDCPALKMMPKLEGLTGLRSLTLSGFSSLEEVGCLGPALEELEVRECRALKRIRDIGGVTSLILRDNALLEEVGPLCPGLKILRVESCGSLKMMPELEGLTCLVTLNLEGVSSLTELGCLSPALELLDVKRCQALKRTPDLGGVTGLKSLTLEDNASLEEVGRLSPALEELGVNNCAALKTMPELEGLTALLFLRVSGCHALKRLPQLAGSTWTNASLEQVGRRSPALTLRLRVYDCAALSELEGLTALEGLSVGHCPALRRLPDCPGLTSLDLSYNASLEKVGRLSPTLAILANRALKSGSCSDDVRGEEVMIIGCPKLRTFNDRRDFFRWACMKK